MAGFKKDALPTVVFAFSHRRVLEPLHAHGGFFQKEGPGLTQQPGKRGDGSSTEKGMVASGCSNSSFANGVKKSQILVWRWGGKHEGVFGCDGGSCGWVGGGDGLMDSRIAARPVPSHGTVPQVLLTVGHPNPITAISPHRVCPVGFYPFQALQIWGKPSPSSHLASCLALAPTKTRPASSAPSKVAK